MAAENYAVTVAGAGDKSGRSGGEMDWANAMDLAAWVGDMTNNAEAGDVYYVEEGTYTLTGAFTSALDGTSALPINIIGVLSGTSNEPPVFSDHAFGANRPVIACAANDFSVDDFWNIRNLDFTITTSGGVTVDTGSIIENCKVVNSGVATRYGFYLKVYGRAIGCEAVSDNGRAFQAALGPVVVACYAHDSSAGYYSGSTDGRFFNSIADTCTTGSDIISSDRTALVNCTIYNCTTGISGTTARYSTFLNNIIDACGTGASWSSEIKSNWWDYNCWNNTSDTTNVTKGDNAVTGDPGMTNPGAGDFSIGTGSNCHDVALDAGDLTGATV